MSKKKDVVFEPIYVDCRTCQERGEITKDCKDCSGTGKFKRGYYMITGKTGFIVDSIK